MSTVALSPEEQVHRVRVCLAEIGYTDPRAVQWGRMRGGGYGVLMDGDMVPLWAMWRALVTGYPEGDTGDFHGCWPCFQVNKSTAGCEHDWRLQPQPARPA